MIVRLSPLRRTVLLLLVIVLTTSGCARIKGIFKDEDENEGVPVEQLYDKGHGMMEGGNWSGATTAFKRLVAQYPYGAYTEQALMEIAFAQYKMGDNDEAISSIDRFLRTYPTHRNTPYMYYLRGLVNSNRDTVFLQKVWKLDASRRDLAAPNQAYSDFATLIDRYPNTRYAQDARQRMVALRNMFARHEMDTTLYYMRRGAWLSAIGRAKGLLENFGYAHANDVAMKDIPLEALKEGNVDPIDGIVLSQTPIDPAMRDRMTQEFEMIKSGF